MNFEIHTEWSLWFLPLFILLAIGYASALYYKEKLFKENKWLPKLLWALRFSAVLLISFLLMNPFIKIKKVNREKPILAIGLDNSISMSYAGKNKTSEQLKDIQNQITTKLADKYQLYFYSIGEKCNKISSRNIQLSEKQTDISEFLTKTYQSFQRRNLSGIVICSDGIYNKGIDPLYVTNSTYTPIYTVGFGDTSTVKDIRIKNINYNKTCYKGNTFPIEIWVEAHDLKNENTSLYIVNNGKRIAEDKINITSTDFKRKYLFQLSTNKSGFQKYTIAIQTVKGEKIIQNNIQNIYIESIDSKKKMVLLYDRPHPDIGAIKRMIEQNDNFELKLVKWNSTNRNILNNADAIILYQLPSAQISTNELLTQAEKNKIPVLFILGEQTSVQSINQLNLGLNIGLKKLMLIDAQPLFNNSFNAYTTDKSLQSYVENYPPLKVFMGTYKLGMNSSVLLNQKIGSVSTNQPLIFYTYKDNWKIGYILGEGIWKWSLFEMADKSNTSIFKELIDKMMQFMAGRSNKSKFIVKNELNYFENENVYLEAELYNDNFELINEPNVQLTIINSNNKEYNYQFNKTLHAYGINLQNIIPGEYRYKAEVKYKDSLLTATGGFTVSTLDIEIHNVKANHQLLFTLSAKSQGQFFDNNEVDRLISTLKNRKDITDRLYTTEETRDIIDYRWLAFIIIILLSLEWFLRKRNGAL